MKTPDEIKKGLAKCSRPVGTCRGNCPYYNTGIGAVCIPAMSADSLAYIQQLEAKLAECGNNLMCRSCANCAHNVVNHLSEYCRDCDCGSNWEEGNHAER